VGAEEVEDILARDVLGKEYVREKYCGAK